ncbi:conserved hypothetical protein (DUF1853) [Formosa agariphila KMM 3901]|uniref:DUF1853 family protein n=1 Tax=Formosa agariphila (strain DSM 15362 / KCTC 12365 / LMG 23005 / KMM 3901 / M-2Alg 35-1) TaxID=1347342 RepID=T2KLN6_FORAG|nr:DUF1853 family protein [Formosa agariphila]CDF79363.1 conserved hypothetical protein (DUF1853) [Formosa agariphila KMM 3901]
MKSNFHLFEGYKNTRPLWNGRNSWGMQQFEMKDLKSSQLNRAFDTKLRLGKLVERFVDVELTAHDNIEIIAENLQIQKEKRTLGEIDCILKRDEQLIHLEIIYKFYLYDPEVGITEFDHWIGPNRKDSLVDKLTKLHEKQLPLLFNPETKKYLDAFEISSDHIEQQVYFKAQLFLPYGLKTNVFTELNPDCVTGFYIRHTELELFQDCKFYMPKKTDWLCEIQIQLPWMNFNTFKTQLQPLIDTKTSPLCWIKRPNGVTEKCFVVWWN